MLVEGDNAFGDLNLSEKENEREEEWPAKP